MSNEYADDIRRYASSVDERALDGIIRHLGIALRSPDASMVSCSSKDELDRVRESWLKKKLGLTEADAALDRAIADVCAKMKGDPSKSRVTFYYLLAEKYGKLKVLAA
jgi:hypothetical protein